MTDDNVPGAPDLSGAFGWPATARLRGLLPPRPGGPGGHPVRPDDHDRVADDAEADPNPDGSGAPAIGNGRARAARNSVAGSTNRRWGVVRMTSREHVELVVLVALRRGPADGRELAARLHADSGGCLRAPANTVQRTLHRLARGGLLERESDDGRPRYRLTESGMRVARSRERDWAALRRAVDAVTRSSPALDR